MNRFAIIGATGRMGQALQLVSPTPLLCIDVNRNASGSFASLHDLKETPDVVIDFSTPLGCINALDFCVERNIPFVSGTTGLDKTQLEKIHDAALSIPIILAANYSVGVHLLARAIAQTAAATQAGDWDIEISEAHHRNKVDAPGGTALFLGEVAAKHRNQDFNASKVLSREGHTGKRNDKEIGFQVLRGGSIVGTHSVSFCADGEIVELTHKALDRSIFARGALRAAHWIKSKKPGFYSMEDVLFN